MTDAMKVLYQYAEEHMVHPFMTQTPEYSRICFHVEQQGEAFRAMLNDEMTQSFEQLAAEQHQLDFIYEQALFRAGFQIALELMR